jgi:hypothetical protein
MAISMTATRKIGGFGAQMPSLFARLGELSEILTFAHASTSVGTITDFAKSASDNFENGRNLESRAMRPTYAIRVEPCAVRRPSPWSEIPRHPSQQAQAPPHVMPPNRHSDAASRRAMLVGSTCETLVSK